MIDKINLTDYFMDENVDIIHEPKCLHLIRKLNKEKGMKIPIFQMETHVERPDLILSAKFQYSHYNFGFNVSYEYYSTGNIRDFMKPFFTRTYEFMKIYDLKVDGNRFGSRVSFEGGYVIFDINEKHKLFGKYSKENSFGSSRDFINTILKYEV
ncbi:hypothetical protein ACFL1H_01735 [Nanoarchaeota archaeon]